MDLRQLRYFLEMVEQGSLSQAAHRLNVAQSALSIHLRNLETALGTELLTRQRSGVVPTEAGEVLARHARMMLDEQARVIDEIRSLGRNPVGDVRLGLPGTISEILAVPLLEAARSRYPEVRLTISEAMSGFVSDWLMDGHVDLAVLYLEPTEPGLKGIRLLDEDLVVIGAPKDLEAGITTYPDVLKRKLILPSRAHGLRRMLDTAATDVGTSLEPEIEIDSYKNIKALVGRGLGVSILPLYAVDAETRAGKLGTQRFEPPGLSRGVFLINRSTKPLTRAVTAIHDLLSEMVVEVVDAGNWPGAKVPSNTRAMIARQLVSGRALGE